jgi:hypothetical protein
VTIPVALFAACGADSGSSGSATTGGAAVSGQYEFTTADESVQVTLTGVTCTTSGASSFEMSGGEGTTITASATDGSGQVVLGGDIEFEGRVDSAQVSDDGTLVANGTGSIADHTASPTTFEIRGACSA